MNTQHRRRQRFDEYRVIHQKVLDEKMRLAELNGNKPPSVPKGISPVEDPVSPPVDSSTDFPFGFDFPAPAW